MNELEKAMVLNMVAKACAKDPSLARPIIDAVTDGVRMFADKQSDRATKIAFRLFELINSTDPAALKFGTFTKEQVVAELEPCFRGTQGLVELRKKLGVAEPKEEDEGEEEVSGSGDSGSWHTR